MIDHQTLRIYMKYKGNDDALSRVASPSEQTSIIQSDWSKIDRLVRDLYLVVNKLASKEMEKRVLDKLEAELDTEQAKKQIYWLAENLNSESKSTKPWWKFW
jgi:hypothetical protein